MTDLPLEPVAGLPELSLLETRVLGVLAEKQRTVPDSYPLTMNALLTGCNQKSSRDPVMEVSEAEVLLALDNLRSLALVIESSGSRVMRYAHNIERVLRIPTQSTALLTTLFLRGPQTAGELRLNSERLHKFADISSVESFLDELAERPAGALVQALPRQPGAREIRWTHLLSGAPVEQSSIERTHVGLDAANEVAALQEQVAQLQTEVAELRATVARLCAELGVA